jgi:hypothetical protein
MWRFGLGGCKAKTAQHGYSSTAHVERKLQQDACQMRMPNVLSWSLSPSRKCALAPQQPVKDAARGDGQTDARDGLCLVCSQGWAHQVFRVVVSTISVWGKTEMEGDAHLEK